MALMHSQERFEPNLTPILDMVFQLITFFMLVINFKTVSVDTSLKLPVIGSAAPADSATGEFLLLNVDAQGRVRSYGQERAIDQFIAQEAQVARRLRESGGKPSAGDELPITIVLRADRDTPFHLINNVVLTCQKHGFRKFYYRAMTRPQET